MPPMISLPMIFDNCKLTVISTVPSDLTLGRMLMVVPMGRYWMEAVVVPPTPGVVDELAAKTGLLTTLRMTTSRLLRVRTRG